MTNDLAKDLDLLRKADLLIGRIWLNAMARRLGFLVLAGLFAVFGLGMTNVAGFYGLQEFAGPAWAAVIVAIADFILFAMVLLVAGNVTPGSEIKLAIDVRKMAMDAVQADAQDLKLNIDAFGQEIRDVKEGIMGFLQNPLDVAVQKLLVPAATSIINRLRPQKNQS